MVEAFIQAIREDGANILDLVCIRNGVAEARTLHPVAPCQNCYSVTKSFTSTAVGIARDEGLLALDEPITHTLRDVLPERYDDKLERVTIRHLLTQTMGCGEGYLFEADRFQHPDNWLRVVLEKPLDHEPGEKFVYSNSTYYLLSCILHRVTGRTMEEYVREKLFAPLGIRDYAWSSCPMGQTSGATGLYLSTTDMAKLGVLYLNGGTYEDYRVVSEAWVREATAVQVKLERKASYGYGFWIYPDGFEAMGRDSQTVLVRPADKLVLAAHGCEENFNFWELLR